MGKREKRTKQGMAHWTSFQTGHSLSQPWGGPPGDCTEVCCVQTDTLPTYFAGGYTRLVFGDIRIGNHYLLNHDQFPSRGKGVAARCRQMRRVMRFPLLAPVCVSLLSSG